MGYVAIIGDTAYVSAGRKCRQPRRFPSGSSPPIDGDSGRECAVSRPVDVDAAEAGWADTDCASLPPRRPSILPSTQPPFPSSESPLPLLALITPFTTRRTRSL